ncbi:metallophosphoesterase [Paenibacillus sp. LHD-117]|uniref:metallophosphoesterase n=1 Tax=Paenibacillus sp. LHD-117 TaxID=3071412 RepID=UPI0027E164BE|nr:metallophosphoesterase [Paenibacillus sp. LHD-117]MDQ6419859.1 metallophosphoesterase [Paenibacillus sp. LHD-117]
MANHSLSGEEARLFAISDIHGHKDGLLALLEAAAYDPNADRLMLLGDYIDADKPASWDTLDTIRKLVASGALAIPGNQELKLASLARRGNATYHQYAKWILSLPLYLKTGDYLFVHAGIRPGRAFQNQTVRDLTEIREEFYLHPASRITGKRRIVFGHTPTFKLGAPVGTIWSDERRIGIDTGAKHGNRLTLLDLSGSIAYSCETMAGYRSGSDVRVESVAHLLTK